MITRSIIAQSQKSLTIKTYGDSMAPCLLNGDVIFIKKVPFHKIRQNDIVTFHKYGKLISHRVHYVGEKYIICRGDNNIASDGKIYPHQIVGVVNKIKRENAFLDPNHIYLIQSTIYFQELQKFVQQFNEKKIDFVFLKGLPLYLHYENSIPKRLLADCDILIHPDDIKKSISLLKKMGYTKGDTSLSLPHKFLKNHPIQESYYKIVNGTYIILDIHYQALFFMTQLGTLNALYPSHQANKFRADCLKNKQMVSIEGTTFPILSDDYQIVFLLLHFFRDNFSNASRLSHVNSIITKIKPHERHTVLNSVNNIIESYSLTNYLYTPLIILEKYFSSSFTKQLIHQLTPKKRVRLFADQKAKNLEIFNGSHRLQRGKKLFYLLFTLSPRPLFYKVTVFFHPIILFTFGWLMVKKVSPSRAT